MEIICDGILDATIEHCILCLGQRMEKCVGCWIRVLTPVYLHLVLAFLIVVIILLAFFAGAGR
jgi:hypothetical protein